MIGLYIIRVVFDVNETDQLRNGHRELSYTMTGIS